MKREKVINLLKEYFDNGGYFKDLSRRISFETESQNPKKILRLEEYLTKEILPYLSKLGFNCNIYENPDPQFKGPFLFANRYENEKYPTVLIYGHGDVVQGDEKNWEMGLNPWKLTKIGNRLYGRGTADNKGQHTINFAAIKYVLRARKNKLGFNVKILVETGEENGSPGLREFCKKNKKLLSADVLIASDGPRLNVDKPTIFLGSRGVFNFRMKVSLRKGAHHSGNWGGLLSNPGIILSHAISTIISSNGEIKVPDLKAGRIPMPVKKVLKKINLVNKKDDPKIDKNWGEKSFSSEEKVFASNTLEVLSFTTGNPKNPVHAIPPDAVALCHIRYVVPSDPKTFLNKIRKHLDKNGFNMIELEPTRGFMSATRLDPEHPWVKWSIKSLKRTSKKEIDILPNLGGTLPNDVFSDILNLPTIWIPHSYKSCLQHAPNEHLLENITKSGLQLMGGLFWDLGEPGTPN